MPPHTADRNVLRYADLVLDLATMEARRADRDVSLTVLEFRLLEHFARNSRIVLSRSQIPEAVWGLTRRQRQTSSMCMCGTSARSWRRPARAGCSRRFEAPATC